MKNKIVKIGTKTKWGKVVMVGYVGERYYWIIGKDKVVSMMPACVVEDKKISGIK